MVVVGTVIIWALKPMGILIDAGIGIRTIKKTLKDYNILMDSIRAVFITHDHADHIKAVGNLGEKIEYSCLYNRTYSCWN